MSGSEWPQDECAMSAHKPADRDLIRKKADKSHLSRHIPEPLFNHARHNSWAHIDLNRSTLSSNRTPPHYNPG